MKRQRLLATSSLLSLGFLGAIASRVGAQDTYSGECVSAVGTVSPPAFTCGAPCDPPPGSGTCQTPPGGLEISWEPGYCNNEDEDPCTQFEIHVPTSYTLTCNCNAFTSVCGGTILRSDYTWITTCAG